MNLQDIFTHLSSGELSQLFVGESGDIDIDSRKKIASSVELGLIELYKEFLIKENTEAVTLTEGITDYVLASTDVVKVERIKDSMGREVSLNNLNDPCSFTFTEYNSFSIGDNYLSNQDLESEMVSVTYRAAHPKLDMLLVGAYPAGIDIELPSQYLNALLMFIAARVHTPVGMSPENQTGNEYLMKYKAAVAELNIHNIRQDRVSDSSNFHRNGWI
jgi:hypothetical protein